MKIIVTLSIAVVLLLAVIVRMAMNCRSKITKKDRSIIRHINEQDRLKHELETMQIEKHVVERLLQSKMEVIKVTTASLPLSEAQPTASLPLSETQPTASLPLSEAQPTAGMPLLQSPSRSNSENLTTEFLLSINP